MKKILITGGAGFIGWHLARHLLKESDVSLVIADNLQRGKMDEDLRILLANSQAAFLDFDLTDPASYARLGSGYEHVYHLAAVNGTKHFYRMPHEVLRINTLSLAYMLEWFRDKNPQGKFCFTSSNEAYAGGLIAFADLPIPTPEAVPLVIPDTYNPRWSYAATKAIGELFVIHYAAAYGLRAVIVRPHNFYGPRAGYDHVIPEFSARILKREDPFVISGADNMRSFCYIEDAVSAMAVLMDSGKTDGIPVETVHIGDEGEIAMRDLASRMFRIAGWHPERVEIKNAPEGSVARRLPDIAKLRAMTGWSPAVSFDEGLRRTYEWYAAHPAA